MIHHLCHSIGSPARWVILHFHSGRQQDAAGLTGGISLAVAGRLADLNTMQLAGFALTIVSIGGIVSRELRGWVYKSPK